MMKLFDQWTTYYIFIKPIDILTMAIKNRMAGAGAAGPVKGPKMP